MACGPADESVQQELGNSPKASAIEHEILDSNVTYFPQESEPETTPEPTPEQSDEPTPERTPVLTPEPECPHTEGSYPNLSEELQTLVQKYETCELTEEGADAEAPEHFGSQVLVQINLEGRDDSAVDNWMEERSIEPRYTIKKEVPTFFIYAFAPLSDLGPLSQRDTVENVVALKTNLLEGEQPYLPKPAPTPVQNARSEESEPQAELPPWLPYYPHPRTYPGLYGVLNEIAAEYETEGTVSEEFLEKQEADCGVIGQTIHISIRVETSHYASFLDWLESQGLNLDLIGSFNEGFTTVVILHLPFSLLETTGNRSEVYSLETPLCFSPLGRHEAALSGSDDDSSSVGRYRAVVTQGQSLHGADAWHNNTSDPYTGQDVSIGIIDEGFEGLSDLINSGDFPIGKIYGRCYVGSHIHAPTSNYNNCDTGGWHGTFVTETVVDMAPGATFYISNVTGFSADTLLKRTRFRIVANWMVQQGVDVIVHSGGWIFPNSAGTGEPVALNNDPYKTIDLTSDSAILVIAAGNTGGQTWGGPFDPIIGSDRVRRHKFRSGNDRMYLLEKESSNYWRGGGPQPESLPLRATLSAVAAALS